MSFCLFVNCLTRPHFNHANWIANERFKQRRVNLEGSYGLRVSCLQTLNIGFATVPPPPTPPRVVSCTRATTHIFFHLLTVVKKLNKKDKGNPAAALPCETVFWLQLLKRSHNAGSLFLCCFFFSLSVRLYIYLLEEQVI